MKNDKDDSVTLEQLRETFKRVTPRPIGPDPAILLVLVLVLVFVALAAFIPRYP